MSARVNRPLKALRKARDRQPHGVPYAPVEGQLAFDYPQDAIKPIEHSRLSRICPCEEAHG